MNDDRDYGDCLADKGDHGGDGSWRSGTGDVRWRTGDQRFGWRTGGRRLVETSGVPMNRII